MASFICLYPRAFSHTSHLLFLVFKLVMNANSRYSALTTLSEILQRFKETHLKEVNSNNTSCSVTLAIRSLFLYSKNLRKATYVGPPPKQTKLRCFFYGSYKFQNMATRVKISTGVSLQRSSRGLPEVPQHFILNLDFGWNSQGLLS